MVNRAPAGTDNVEFALIEGIREYSSSIDPTMAAGNIMVRGSLNVYRKLSGTIANRPGLKRRGSADTTIAGVKSSFEWATSLGKTLPLRVANSKLQVESDIVTSGTYVWYDLLTALTTTRWVFDSWWDNTLKKDTLLFVGGDTNLYNWSGGMALISSTTANTIVLDRTVASSGITTASGTVKINGNSYSYTGSSASTLTGVTPNPTGEANGSVVIEAVGTNATTPASTLTNDFLKIINNQVYVGSYTSRLVYISKSSSYTDYTQSVPRVPGDGDLLTLDDNCKGIGVRSGNAWISAGESDWYEVSFHQITVGTTLTEQTKVDKKPTSDLSAALGHEFIANIGTDQLLVLTQDHQLRLIGKFTNQFEDKYPSLSLAVKNELEEEDFTGGHVRVVGGIIYITAPVSGKDYMYETRETINPLGNIVTERFWHPPQARSIARFAVIGGTLYGHSSANPQIYQVWDTLQWYDDSPSGSQLPYSSVMLLAYQNGGRRQGKIEFDKLFVEGYAASSSNLYAGIYYDYEGASGLVSPVLNTSDNLFPVTFTGVIPPSLGDQSLGDVPLGDGLNVLANDQALLPKFKVIVGVQLLQCFEYALMVYSGSASSRWEVLAIGTNQRLSISEAIEIIK